MKKKRNINNFKKLSILDETPDEIIYKALLIDHGKIFDLLLKTALDKNKKGEPLNRDYNIQLFGRNSSRGATSQKIKRQLFDVLILKDLRRETNFKKIAKIIFQLRPDFANLSAKIMFDRIEFGITGFNTQSSLMFLNSDIDNSLKERFIDFLKFSSIDDKFLKYTSMYESGDFKQYPKDFEL